MKAVIFDAGGDWDVLAAWRAEMLGWRADAERRPGWTAFTFTKWIGGKEFSIDGAGKDARELGGSLLKQRSGLLEGSMRFKDVGRLCMAFCWDLGVLLHGNGVIGTYEVPYDETTDALRKMKKDCNGKGEAHIYKWRYPFRQFALDV